MAKTIFNYDKMVDALNGQTSRVRFNRVGLLDETVAQDLNTYRNWGDFNAVLQTVEEITSGKITIKGHEIATATKPLFSNINAVVSDSSYRENLNVPLLDSQATRQKIASATDCSIKNLIALTEAGKMGRNTFQYSDFMYCKYLNRVANNQMIVLRRFPYPCGDYIDYSMFPDSPEEIKEKGAQSHLPDIARMVTWMGTPGNEMSNILKYSFNMRWESKNAGIQNQDMKDEGGGVLGNFLNSTNKTYLEQVQQGTAGKQMGIFGKFAESDTPYSEFTNSMYDENKNYGPMDVIDSVTIRKTGLDFSQDIELQFDYEMRSFDGINQKSAFLDLIANILACTYTNGTFWGGERRVYGAHQSNVFANLPIMQAAAGGKLTDLTTIGDSIIDSFNSIAQGFKSQYAGTNGSWMDALKNFGASLMGALAGAELNKLGRPQKKLWNSLLTDAPTGLWHVMIGNPLNPIMSIGNLILEKATIEHYGPLGLDDFPTGIRVKVTLKPARARDNADIERLYMHGDARIYAPMNDRVLDMYENSKSMKVTNRADVQSNATPTTRALDNEASGENTSKTTTIGTTDNTTNAVTNAQTEKQRLLTKFFGTTSTHSIVLTSKEAFAGSHNIEKKRNADQNKK